MITVKYNEAVGERNLLFCERAERFSLLLLFVFFFRALVKKSNTVSEVLYNARTFSVNIQSAENLVRSQGRTLLQTFFDEKGRYLI